MTATSVQMPYVNKQESDNFINACYQLGTLRRKGTIDSSSEEIAKGLGACFAGEENKTLDNLTCVLIGDVRVGLDIDRRIIGVLKQHYRMEAERYESEHDKHLLL